MQQRLTRLRQSHVVKQVAAGREFKGQPFRAKPEVVLFKVCLRFSAYVLRLLNLITATNRAAYMQMAKKPENLESCC